MQPIDPAPPALPGSVVASQTWRDLAFVHWPVDPARVAPLLPAGVVPDLHDGSTWAGLIAFELSDATLGPLARTGRWGRFTEMNVRLYGVDAEGRRGVVFRSLEARSLPAVLGARAAFSLPYRWAATGQRRTPDGWEYASVRHGLARPRFRLRVAVDRWRTQDDPPSTFLTARWGLFQRGWGTTWWVPNTHERWVLHPATVVDLRDDLLAAGGLPGVAATAPASVLFSPGVTARFARPQRLRRR